MKNLLCLVLLACGLAYSQGVRYDIPTLLTQSGRPLPNVNISLCPGSATISGTTCSPSTQSFTDITLATQCPVGNPVKLPQSSVCDFKSDPRGNAGFWLSPGAYIYCLNGPGITGKCYNLSVPVGVTSGTGTMAGIVSAATALGGPGKVFLPCATYSGTTTMVIPTNLTFLELAGQGKDCTIINLTATGSVLHALNLQGSAYIHDLTIQAIPGPATNLNMKGISLDSSAFTMAAGTQLQIERVKITGFNIGIFADGRFAGGCQNLLDRVVVRDSDITIQNGQTGPAGPVVVHGAKNVFIEDNQEDSRTSGDHVNYLIQDLNVNVVANTMKGNGTSVANGFCVKLAHDTVNCGATSFTYSRWSVRDNSCTNSMDAVLANPAVSDELSLLDIKGNDFRQMTDTGVGNYAIQISPGGTSLIDNLYFIGNKLENLQRGGIILQQASGAVIRNVNITDDFVRNFSQFSSGTDSGITAGSAGTYPSIKISGLRVDGASTGRAAYNFTGATIRRLQIVDMTETNITNASTPGLTSHRH